MTRLSEDHGNPPTFTLVSASIARKFGGSVKSAGSRGTTLRLCSSGRSASSAIQLGSSDKECQLIVSTQQLGSSVQSASSAGGSSAARHLCQQRASSARPLLVPVRVQRQKVGHHTYQKRGRALTVRGAHLWR
eukprot:TRINITY_DN2928_c8_g1_i1.p1 TRINITY_DN2928_c8_g1~~TRINITY_DN2928_c8_g1_i1.p1  ORF type:complete len:133 (+),score=3.47 TRINITY_DN2928_c8_g1_i1:45-443(+)